MNKQTLLYALKRHISAGASDRETVPVEVQLGEIIELVEV